MDSAQAPTPFAFHQPFAWSTARLLQARAPAWRARSLDAHNWPLTALKP
jgi:hypothetical protein